MASIGDQSVETSSAAREKGEGERRARLSERVFTIEMTSFSIGSHEFIRAEDQIEQLVHGEVIIAVDHLVCIV